MKSSHNMYDTFICLPRVFVCPGVSIIPHIENSWFDYYNNGYKKYKVQEKRKKEWLGGMPLFRKKCKKQYHMYNYKDKYMNLTLMALRSFTALKVSK